MCLREGGGGGGKGGAVDRGGGGISVIFTLCFIPSLDSFLRRPTASVCL